MLFTSASNVVVQLEGSQETIELFNISGNQSASMLEAQVKEKLNKDQLTQYKGIHTVEFKDAVDDNNNNSASELNASYNNENVNDSGSIGLTQLIVGLPYWQDSMWNNGIHTAESMRSEQIELLRLNKPFEYPSPKLLFTRYRNLLAYWFSGLKSYREFGNDRLDIKV